MIEIRRVVKEPENMGLTVPLDKIREVEKVKKTFWFSTGTIMADCYRLRGDIEAKSKSYIVRATL